MHSNQTSIWTAIIDEQFLGVDNMQSCDAIEQSVYPNPFADNATVCFKLLKRSYIQLSIKDMKACTQAVLIEGEMRERGKYCESFSAASMGLPPGVYLLVLQSNEKVSTQKIVVR
jgi:hypothetical protein